jgi:hypothetical protein
VIGLSPAKQIRATFAHLALKIDPNSNNTTMRVIVLPKKTKNSAPLRFTPFNSAVKKWRYL